MQLTTKKLVFYLEGIGTHMHRDTQTCTHTQHPHIVSQAKPQVLGLIKLKLTLDTLYVCERERVNIFLYLYV